MRRIICVGNRYVASDVAGPLVFDLLQERGVPPGIELVDGGLGGLNLLSYVDGAERVVFVDSVTGTTPPGEVVLLSPAEVSASAGTRFDHGSGLDYLLGVLPHVCEVRVPEIRIVGIAGEPDPESVEAAASLALQAVVHDPPCATGWGRNA